MGDGFVGIADFVTEQILGGIALYVEVNHQGFFAFNCADRCQITGYGGFTYAAFLIKNHPAHNRPRNLENKTLHYKVNACNIKNV
jgi:hypothetical protein